MIKNKQPYFYRIFHQYKVIQFIWYCAWLIGWLVCCILFYVPLKKNRDVTIISQGMLSWSLWPLSREALPLYDSGSQTYWFHPKDVPILLVGLYDNQRVLKTYSNQTITGPVCGYVKSSDSLYSLWFNILKILPDANKYF